MSTLRLCTHLHHSVDERASRVGDLLVPAATRVGIKRPKGLEITPKVFKAEVKENINPQLHFEGLMDYEEVVIQEKNVQPTVEHIVEHTVEATLLEDLKACDFVSKTNDNKATLIHWLNTTDDRPKAISEIIKIFFTFSPFV